MDIETTGPAVDINDTGGGDPEINFQISGTTTFSIGIDNSDSDKLKIGTTAPDASTSVTIDASQNVGIGTTSPSEILDIVGNAEINGDIYMDAATTETRRIAVGDGRTGDGISRVDLIGDATYTDFGLRLTRGAGENAQSHLWHRGTGNFWFYAQEAADLRFVTNNSTNMILTSAGLLGVGNASPNTTLHLGNTDATANAVEDMLTLTKETSGTPANGIGVGVVFEIEDALTLAEEQGRINVELDDVTEGAEDATMTFDINQNGTMTEVMRIDGTDGYVGIGTSSPSSNLHVKGDLAAWSGGLSVEHTAAGFETLFRINPGYDAGTETANTVTFDINGTGTFLLWKICILTISCQELIMHAI